MEQSNSSLIKVKLSISSWDGKSYSKKATHRVEDDYDVSTGYADVRLRRIPKDITDPVNSAATKARSEFNAITVPFEDGGWRVVKAEKFPALEEKVNLIQQGFRESVVTMSEEMRKREDEIRAINNKFDDDFSFVVDDIVKKFGVYLYVRSVGKISDMHFPGLTDDKVAELRGKIANEYKESISENVNNMMHLAHDLLSDIKDKLPKLGTDEGKGIKVKTLVSKAMRISKTLRDLNISDNPDVYGMADEIENMFKGVEPDDIRKDTGTREQAVAQADGLLSSIANMG